MMAVTDSTSFNKAIRRTAVIAAAALSTLTLSGCERAKTRLDREVDRLCAVDGGIRVFETVEVPAEYLPDEGPIFPQYEGRRFKDRYGPDYELKTSDTYIVTGLPSLTRMETQLIRKRDQKVLGTSVRYIRHGGDFLPRLGPDSSHLCPPIGTDRGLEREVFIKQGGNQ
jgi:hypothetical protein